LDTIFAVSSGAAPAGVAVIRVSGPDSRFVVETIAGDLPDARRAALRMLRDPASGDVLDQALVLWFPGPGSFTGEDVAEFHCHGGRAVVAAMLAVLARFPGCRPAMAGEFTRRAFDNERLDLIEVEGLADLVAAETEAQRRLAMTQAGGALTALYDGWRSRLLRVRAMIEAELDFAEEEDVPDDISDVVWKDVSRLLAELEAHLDRSRAAERLRNGLQVVLLGRPNAGKSSLLNAIARRDVAIVTEEAGTTRDMIEVHLDLGGLPVTLVDTAGLRETAGLVESEGIRRALARAETADLVLWLVEPGCPNDGNPDIDSPPQSSATVWRVRTKADIAGELPPVVDGDFGSDCGSALWDYRVSARTGAGMDLLLSALAEFAREHLSSGLDDPVATRERHRWHLVAAKEGLRQALDTRQALELRAEELRRAADQLGQVTGRIGVEDLLDVIFGEFCIGK
jgi:tRNA modification GTPase